MDSDAAAQRWALLIGIGFYMTGNARKDSSGRVIHYHSLGGCVNDIALVDCFLRDEVGVAEDHIIKLTSSAPDDPMLNQPREDPRLWPTYNNIFRAFQDTLTKAKKDDLVYIHYSGHGTRVRTVFEGIKGRVGFDESLVPVDIEVVADKDQGRYVRDIELATWLHKFVEKGVRVTIVLDSCHAGSSNRTGAYSIRGIATEDNSFLPTDSCADGPFGYPTKRVEALRDGTLHKSWLLEAAGYTLLGACTAFQKAHEYSFAERTYGVLTYSLIEALRADPNAPKPSILLGRIAAKVQSRFSKQTPVLDGDDGASFFNLRGEVHSPDIRVLTVDVPNNSVRLDHGDLHGINLGTEFEVFSEGAQPAAAAPLATVRVTGTQGLTSTATFMEMRESDPRRVKPGCKVSLSKQAAEGLPRVRLRPCHDGSLTIEQRNFREHTNKQDPLCLAWRLLSDDDTSSTADLFVTAKKDGQYGVLDASQEPIPNCPSLRFEDPGSMERLARFLSHVSRFRHVQRLTADQSIALTAPCLFEVEGTSTKPPTDLTIHSLSSQLEFPEGLQSPVLRENIYTMRSREIISVVFRNTGKITVYLTILDLKPLWGIEKFYPSGASWSEPIGPGEARHLPIRMEIPDAILQMGATEITETLKAIVTLNPTNLEAVLLPEFMKTVHRNKPDPSMTTALDRLLEQLFPKRTVVLQSRSLQISQWQAFDIMVRTIVGDGET